MLDELTVTDRYQPLPLLTSFNCPFHIFVPFILVFWRSFVADWLISSSLHSQSTVWSIHAGHCSSSANASLFSRKKETDQSSLSLSSSFFRPLFPMFVLFLSCRYVHLMDVKALPCGSFEAKWARRVTQLLASTAHLFQCRLLLLLLFLSPTPLLPGYVTIQSEFAVHCRSSKINTLKRGGGRT